jgi:hypothetical protein
MAVAAGCNETLPRSPTGDLSRRLAPPPACILRLPSRSTQAASTRNIPEEAWWSVVFPNYDARDHALPEHSLTCQGRDVFASSAFDGGSVRGGSWPLKVEDGDIVMGTGVNKIRLLWLRTHTYSDGTSAGPLVLARVLESNVEVYSVGAYRGSTDRTKLKLERMGNEILPSAQSDGCLNRKDKSPCTTDLRVFIPIRGELKSAASIPLERITYSAAGEPGTVGPIEYRLISTPSFEPGGIRLVEQVAALDEQGRDLRKAELERMLRATADGFEASEGSLWERMFVANQKQNPSAKHRPELDERR